MRHGESAISLVGLAITLLAWIVPQDRIGYEVKFALLGAGLMAIDLGVVLLVRGWLRGRWKQQALDQLSEAISQAIHQLVNKPRYLSERVFEMVSTEYSQTERTLQDRMHVTFSGSEFSRR